MQPGIPSPGPRGFLIDLVLAIISCQEFPGIVPFLLVHKLKGPLLRTPHSKTTKRVPCEACLGMPPQLPPPPPLYPCRLERVVWRG